MGLFSGIKQAVRKRRQASEVTRTQNLEEKAKYSEKILEQKKKQDQSKKVIRELKSMDDRDREEKLAPIKRTFSQIRERVSSGQSKNAPARGRGIYGGGFGRSGRQSEYVAGVRDTISPGGGFNFGMAGKEEPRREKRGKQIIIKL